MPGRKPRRCATRRGNGSLRAPRTAESLCAERNPAAPSRSWRRASPGTVWPAHGLTRQLFARFTPLHEPLCRRRGRFAAFRRSQTAETGGKDVRCPGGNSVSAASFRFAALHETVRPHSKNGNGLTPRSSGYAPGCVAPPCFPCRTSPDAPLAGRGVSANRARARATRPTNPGHESSTLALRTAGMKEQPTLRFSLRCEAGRRLCFPVATQGLLSAKPPQCRIPLAREPSASGPRRLHTRHASAGPVH